MADFAVSTKYTAVDKMSGPFNKMKNTAMGFGSVLKGVLSANIITAGFNRLAGGVRETARAFVDFDASITKAGAKFKDMSKDAATAQKQMEGLKAAARGVGATTEFNATEAAEGLDFLAMAGFGVEQSMAALPGVVNLATAANADLATATDIASDSLGAFNLMTEDTIQLEKNLARVNDVMAKTTTTANTDLVTLFESVKKGAPAFTAAGQSIETFSALAGIMANAGVKGAESGTSLRNVMLRLSKPTDEAQKVLDKLNVKTQDSQGNFRDVVDILEDMETGLKDMGSVQKTAALSTVFGARSVTGINILLAEGTDKLRDYRKSLESATGASQTMADVIRGSLDNRIKVLQSSLTEVGFKFIDAFGDKLSQGLNNVIIFTNKISDFIERNKDLIALGIDQTINFIGEAFRITGAIISTTVDIIKTGIDTVVRFKEVFAILTGAVVAYKLVVLAVNTVQAINIGLMALAPVLSFIKVMSSLAKTEGILATAQLALNMAMNANPIALVITGVAALVGLGVALYKNWDKVGPVFEKVGRAIMSFLLAPVNMAINAIVGLLTLVSKIPGMGDKMQPAIDMMRKIQTGVNTVTLKGDKEDITPSSPSAPNEVDESAMREMLINSRFNGTLNIAGAPEGSEIKTSQEAPGFDINMLGVQGL